PPAMQQAGNGSCGPQSIAPPRRTARICCSKPTRSRTRSRPRIPRRRPSPPSSSGAQPKSPNPSKICEMGASDSTPFGRGVGPSVVGQLVRDRSLRLAAALAIAVARPVAVLFYFQFRAIEDLGQSSAVVLRQLSQETANRLVRDVQDALRAPQIDVLLGTTQQQAEPLDLPAIRKVFNAA